MQKTYAYHARHWQEKNMKNLCLIVFLSTVLVGSLLFESAKCADTKASKPIQKQIDDFRNKIKKDLTPRLAIELFGKPDRIAGSGLTIFVYSLENQNELWIGFPGEAPLLYAFIKHPDGNKSYLFPIR